MMDVPQADRQKYLIDAAEQEKASADFCYMISEAWWRKWRAFVENFGTDSPDPAPGVMDNRELIRPNALLCLDSHPSDDWLDMRLKTDISENIDYVIVCEGVWRMLHEWYGGGPKIRLAMVDRPGQLSERQPDLRPVVLFHRNANESRGLRGILMSLWAKVRQLVTAMAEEYGTDPQQLTVGFHDDRRNLQVGLRVAGEGANLTLFEVGVTERSLLLVNTGLCVNVWSNGTASDEDSDYKRALELSLQDSLPRTRTAAEADMLLSGEDALRIEKTFTPTIGIAPDFKRLKTEKDTADDEDEETKTVVMPLNPESNLWFGTVHPCDKNANAEMRQEFEAKFDRASAAVTEQRMSFPQRDLGQIVEFLSGLERELATDIMDSEHGKS